MPQGCQCISVFAVSRLEGVKLCCQPTQVVYERSKQLLFLKITDWYGQHYMWLQIPSRAALSWQLLAVSPLSTQWIQGVKVLPDHAMKAYRGSRGIALLILNIFTRWRWVVDFTLRSLYPLEGTLYQLNRGLSGLQSRLGCSGWEINLLPVPELERLILPGRSIAAVSIWGGLIMIWVGI